MQLPGQLKEAVGKTCLRVECGSLFPGSMAGAHVVPLPHTPLQKEQRLQSGRFREARAN
jgi:hypothetical protein